MQPLFSISIVIMKFCFIVLSFFALIKSLDATPSSVFWTVCTTDVQPFGVLRIGDDNYFTVFNRRNRGQSFPTDIGLTYGLFDWKQIQCEVGIDYLGGANDPLYFNTKVGIRENILFSYAPAINVGIFNIGTRCRGDAKTDQNIIDLIVGKSLPKWMGSGSVYFAGFTGSRAMGKNRQGFMVAFAYGFAPRKDCEGIDYHKWVLAADYASGKNSIGGGGLGVYYFFTPRISLLTGPVWFNDAGQNGRWKWSIQMDGDIPLLKKHRSCH